MIHVLIADDHYLVRQGIRTLLERAADITVIAEAKNGHDVMRLVDEHSPDVVVMDISMPQMDGLMATQRLQQQKSPPKIVILSMYANVDLVERAIKHGALGYLLKRSTASELVRAVRSAHRGALFLGSNLNTRASDLS